jgi:hypothetical protein
MKQQAKSVRTPTGSPADLTGRRFGKWTVLKYAGKRSSARMWLCRCDCGVEKEVQHYNLTTGSSKKCQQCQYIRHEIFSTRIYRAWKNLKRDGKLSKEWQDFDAFRKAVGDPPDKEAHLTRYDGAKPHSAENTFWMYPALLQNDPGFLDRLKQIRKALREERVAHDKTLMRIRNAKSKEERNRCMIAARKAGYTCGLIAMAAKVTTQRAQYIVTIRCH